MVSEKITQYRKPHGEEGFETINNMNENHKEISEFAFDCINIGENNDIRYWLWRRNQYEKFLKLTSRNVDGLDYSKYQLKLQLNKIKIQLTMEDAKSFNPMLTIYQ